MSDENTWFLTAEEHLENAKTLFSKDRFPLAYQEALTSVEVVFKAVLKKENKFVDRSKQRGGDKHHDISELLKKIRDERCLPISTIEDIENVIISQRFERVNLTSDGGDHADCYSEEGPNIRYPIVNSTPSKMVKKEDAEEKTSQAEEIFVILKPFFKSDNVIPPDHIDFYC